MKVKESLEKPSRMNWSAYHSTLSVALVVTALSLFGQLNRNSLAHITNYLTPVLALAALALAVLNVANVGLRRNDRLSVVWFSFMLTLVLWFLSEVALSFYPLVLIIPYVAFADVFGLAGYLPIMFGLLVLVWPFKGIFASKKSGGAILLVGSSAVLITLLPMFVPQPGGTLVNLAYPILDVVALAIAVPALMIFLKGTFWRPFLILVVGLILALGAHVLFAVTDLNGTYSAGYPLDLIYDWGFLLAALGFYLRRKQFLVK